MSDQQDQSRQPAETSQADIDEGTRVGFVNVDAFEDRVHLEMHQRHHGHHINRVDLNAEEYTPEELARLLGTSLDVVLHAARSGELKAQRAGHTITCIQHADVVAWLQSRGPGV